VGFSGSRDVGFSLPKKPVTVYGPRVREPQKTIELPSGKAQKTEAVLELPFQIYDTGTSFVSRAGTFNGSYGELTQVATTDGTWRLYAKLTINETTGTTETSSVEWYASTQTDSPTTYYHLIGTGVVSGGGTTRTVTNSNYGPISYLVRGGVTNDWTVNIY
jgi:hypothetical protein